MLSRLQLFIGIVCLFIFTSTLSSYAGDEIEDLIEIAESKDKIIAIIEGKKTVPYNLRPNEKVLWSGYRGHIGAFLTDLHFYVITTTITSWQALPMRVDESETAVASLSPFIALHLSLLRAVINPAPSLKTRHPMPLIPILAGLI